MSVSPRQHVLSLYRRLVRQQASTFRGDRVVQRSARSEIRKQFAHGRQLTDAAQVEQALKAGHEALDYLRTSVIQAERKQGNHFGQPHVHTHTHSLHHSHPHTAALPADPLVSAVSPPRLSPSLRWPQRRRSVPSTPSKTPTLCQPHSPPYLTHQTSSLAVRPSAHPRSLCLHTPLPVPLHVQSLARDDTCRYQQRGVA